MRTSSCFTPRFLSNLLIPFYQTRAFLRLKHGAIIESCVSTASEPALADQQASRVHEALNGRKLHEIQQIHWDEILLDCLGTDIEANTAKELSKFIGSKLGCS